MELEDAVLQTCGGVDGGDHVSVELECEGLHIRGGVDGDEHVGQAHAHPVLAAHTCSNFSSGALSTRLPPGVEHLEAARLI